MKLLSIETSTTENFSLAVTDGAKVLGFKNSKLNQVLSSSIISQIKQILGKAKLNLSDLDGFAIGLGPGSFTSLRVGLATIKAFCFAGSKPIIGVPSLDVLAMNAKGETPICAVVDAKRNLVYACLYDKKKETLKRKSDYLLISPDDLLKKIKGKVTFIGNGIPMIKKAGEIFNKEKRSNYKFASEKLWYPQANILSILACERIRENKLDDVAKIVPLYLYPKDCQVQK